MLKYCIMFLCIGLYGCGSTTATTRIVPGPKGDTGAPGIQGLAGADGHSAVFKAVTADSSVCPTGGYVLSAGVDLNNDSVLQVSETKSVAVVCNGAVGSTGASGQAGKDATLPPFAPIALVDPCGTNPHIYNEVFLRLANGMLLASFSDDLNGRNTRFSVLVPGNYMTSDGDNCSFTVDANGNITNESHHN
jgi:hypothetical protein